MVDITVQDLVKSFGAHKVFDGLNLGISDGAYVCLLGPSGCGKSTLMRIISGLDSADGGSIRFDDRDVGNLTCAQRDVGMAFQNYALYPHLTVEGNLRFPLKSPIQKGRWTEETMRARVAEIAELLKIGPYLHRTIDQLSGGQQQRVSLGRSLVRRPRVLLLDEPVTHLDARLRYSMRSELKRIHSVMETTTIHVTHDQQEALAMADLLVIMRNGKIEQAAPAMEVYNDPNTRFVAGFLGDPPRTLLEVKLAEEGGRMTAEFAGQRLPLLEKHDRTARQASNRDVTLALEARSLSVAEAGSDDAFNGNVTAHEMIGGAQRIVLDVMGQRLNLQSEVIRQVAIGDTLAIRIGTDGALLFDGKSGERIRAS